MDRGVLPGRGIFLAPIISGREPRRQHWLTWGLLGAVAIVVFGSLAGEAISIFGADWAKGSIFFDQQWEYLDLPRFWQFLLVVGCSCGSRSSTAGSGPG